MSRVSLAALLALFIARTKDDEELEVEELDDEELEEEDELDDATTSTAEAAQTRFSKVRILGFLSKVVTDTPQTKQGLTRFSGSQSLFSIGSDRSKSTLAAFASSIGDAPPLCMTISVCCGFSEPCTTERAVNSNLRVGPGAL